MSRPNGAKIGILPLHLHSAAAWIISLCFLAAFISYFTQYYGLLSPCGVTPLTDTSALFPPLLLAFFGVTLSSVSTISPRSRFLAFPVLTLLYQNLLVSASSSHHVPFYNFQWDNMLLEVGLVASWQQIGSLIHPTADAVTSHLPRMMLFKLMFMSGLVKIQSNCPTWLKLTALEYHYATQPLPTPLAWHALNHLNPLLQRLSVAATLVVEIAAPFLLLSPIKVQREMGSRIQLMLQVLIALTGSYTFFNLLTAAACLAVWEGPPDFDIVLAGQKHLKKLQVLSCYVFLAYLTGRMFSVGALVPNVKISLEDTSWLKHVGIDLLWDPDEATGEWKRAATSVHNVSAFKSDVLSDNIDTIFYSTYFDRRSVRRGLAPHGCESRRGLERCCLP